MIFIITIISLFLSHTRHWLESHAQRVHRRGTQRGHSLRIVLNASLAASTLGASGEGEETKPPPRDGLLSQKTPPRGRRTPPNPATHEAPSTNRCHSPGSGGREPEQLQRRRGIGEAAARRRLEER